MLICRFDFFSFKFMVDFINMTFDLFIPEREEHAQVGRGGGRRQHRQRTRRVGTDIPGIYLYRVS